MLILYDILFVLFAIAYLPVLLVRGKMHRGFGTRFGLLPEGQRFERPLWVHAVSVGEAASVRHLIDELRLDFPGRKFVISTITTTGNTIAASIAGKGDFVTYLPLDFGPIVNRTLDRVNPCALIIVETELWPNLICSAARRGIPVFVVNGRVSDRSFPRYRLIKPLLAPVLNRITLFCVQTEQDGRKLAELGLKPERIRVTGNMKFDIKVRDYDELKKDYRDYRQSFGIGSREKLWIAASTHQGEERIVLETFRSLRERSPHLRLLVAPRHPERSGEVAEQVREAGFTPVRISELSAAHGTTGNERTGNEVFLLDTVGKLMYFYAIADIVFVGGSLVPTGGHNILEPASLGKPVLFGPHTFNFKDIVALFLSHNAALRVDDGAALTREISALLADQARAGALGAAARGLITGNQGATVRNKEAIKSHTRS
ncbi:MAG: 3-deoxy-D-manno-octulosonic acid transferase [Deltaproteobacteria bacterium]